jgi:hypothetical protein
MDLFDYSIFAGKTVLVPDLDMSVIDNRERRGQAEKRGRAQGREVDYDFFYDEDNLALDRPMPEKLALLWHALSMGLCDQLCYLSSRPQSMWYGSATWLQQHGYPFPYQLLLRRQFQKTVVFKREELETIARYATHVFFFDDSEIVRQAVAGLEHVITYASIEDLFAEHAPSGLMRQR